MKKLIKTETIHSNTIQAYASCTCSCSCKCGTLNPAYFGARSSGKDAGAVGAKSIA